MRTQSRLAATMVTCSPAPRSTSWAQASTAVVKVSPGSRHPSHRPCWTRWTMASASFGSSSSSI
eukprot:2325860-Lingulodinium_polyedra.AAC.1